MNNFARLEQQIHFLVEIDKLKSILRRSYLVNGERRENTAEHSWHLAMAALVLAEHANEPVDMLRVLKMLVLHDVVEIDAGDTFLYDTAGNQDKAAREQAAADRIFGLLPPEQAAELRALWEEFDARHTPDARFAGAMDRLMPLLHNYHTNGRSWNEHHVTASQIKSRTHIIAEGSEALWEYGRSLLEDLVTKGHLKP